MARAAVATILLTFTLSACGGGSDGQTPVSTPPATTETKTLEPTPNVSSTPVAVPHTEPAANITLPPGFSAYVIATGFFRPTSIALAGDGTVYVSERHGRVERIADADGDGVFESTAMFLETSGEITGVLAARDGGLLVSTTGALLLARDTDGDGTADSSAEVVPGLPHGLHQNNGVVYGPDGKLYVTNGSTCDECDEADERSGAILQANPDGSSLRVFATGLRNPYDLVFDAQDRLWATDNGSDAPCETVDELNVIRDGGDYGWPYSGDGCNPLADGIQPAALLGLHTASTGIDSYGAGQFPPAYRGNLFMTLWGSFFTEPELPPQLLRAVVEETADGPRAKIGKFAEGFVHPIDVLIGSDGTLLVLDYGEGGADDTSGALYRIIYTG